MDHSKYELRSIRKARKYAVDVLVKHQESDISLRAVLRRFEMEFSLKRDLSSKITYLTMNTMRFLNTIDFILSRSSRRLDINRLPPHIQQRLRLAVFEIRWATVQVDDVLSDYFSSRSKYEQILRKAKKINLEVVTRKMPSDNRISIIYSHPTFLVEILRKHLGNEDAIDLLRRNNQPPQRYIRINRLKNHNDEILENSPVGVILQELPRNEDIFRLKEGLPKLLASELYKKSMILVQDYASVMAAKALQVKPGDTVWDACAAPGMKTQVMEEMLQGEGRIIATDISPRRIKTARKRSQDYGFKNTEWVLSDASNPCVLVADKILIDAPCTSTGMIWSHPYYKWRLNKHVLFSIMAIQNKILEGIINAYQDSPETEILYSTCSVLPHEGESQIDSLLDRDMIELLEVSNLGNNGYRGFKCSQRVRRMFPHKNETDGFFMAKFRVKH